MNIVIEPKKVDTHYISYLNGIDAFNQPTNETALVIKNPTRNDFYILDGDWTETYEPHIEDLDKLKEIFLANTDSINGWSQSPKELEDDNV